MSITILPLIGMLAGPATPADDPDYVAAVEAADQRRYAEAAALFRRAYARNSDPLILFVWGQAERLNGNCEDAVSLYRRYLALEPPEADVAYTKQQIEACGADPDAAPSPAVEPDPEGSTSDPPPPPPMPASRERETTASPDDSLPPVGRDRLGHGLTWSGVVVAGIGAGLLGEAHRRRVAGDGAPTELDYREQLAGAPALSRAGIGILVAGGVLLTAGVVRFSVVASKRRRSRESAALRWSGPGLAWKFELAPRRLRALR